MTNPRALRQKLPTISRLWDAEDYDAALAEVDRLLKSYPGNAHLHVLWASLVQLQEQPRHGLNDAKQALQQAAELEPGSPAAAIELGHFLDAVEDDPQAAAKVFAEAVAAARQLLAEGLIGQARALVQLGKREEARRCVLEAVVLTQNEPVRNRGKANGTASAGSAGSPGRGHGVRPNGALAEQIEEMIGEVLTHRSA